jgi:hypothetical protein
MLATPIHGVIDPNSIPVGSEHLDALPRALAGIGSGVGATVVFVGAAWSAVRFARSRRPGSGWLAGGNALIALGTLVLSSGGLLQGIVGSDEAFALTLAIGIAVIYGGFTVASHVPRASVVDYDASDAPATEPESPVNSRRNNLPANERGNSSTSSTRVGSL